MKNFIRNIDKKKIYTVAVASWGILLIGSGLTMQIMTTPVQKNNVVKLKVYQRRLEKVKSNEIKLKDISIEINQPISVNVEDYLENPSDIESTIISKLKLDTSMVNVNQSGSYTYTITYSKKKYNGTLIVKEKPSPTIETMTLKSLNLKVGSTLSTDIKTYITETIPDEAIANIKLDLSNVNTSSAGNYQYTITYNGKLYTGDITIYQPQDVQTETEKKKDEVNDKENTTATPEISQTQKQTIN